MAWAWHILERRYPIVAEALQGEALPAEIENFLRDAEKLSKIRERITRRGTNDLREAAQHIAVGILNQYQHGGRAIPSVEITSDYPMGYSHSRDVFYVNKRHLQELAERIDGVAELRQTNLSTNTKRIDLLPTRIVLEVIGLHETRHGLQKKKIITIEEEDPDKTQRRMFLSIKRRFQGFLPEEELAELDQLHIHDPAERDCAQAQQEYIVSRLGRLMSRHSQGNREL